MKFEKIKGKLDCVRFDVIVPKDSDNPVTMIHTTVASGEINTIHSILRHKTRYELEVPPIKKIHQSKEEAIGYHEMICEEAK